MRETLSYSFLVLLLYVTTSIDVCGADVRGDREKSFRECIIRVAECRGCSAAEVAIDWACTNWQRYYHLPVECLPAFRGTMKAEKRYLAFAKECLQEEQDNGKRVALDPQHYSYLEQRVARNTEFASLVASVCEEKE